MARLKALWEQVIGSLWFLPALLTIGAAVLALLAVTLGERLVDDLERRSLWWLFGGGAEGARGVLGAIAGSIITVTGVVFSVTIVALQLASTQLSPRVLRQFMADRANQVVLGVFIGTFTYTLLVQRTVRSETGDGERFVPALAVTGAVMLALVSIGFLIFFIDHLARSIQADAVIDRVARETLDVIESLESRESGTAGHDSVDGTDVPEDDPDRLAAVRSGYIQHVEEGQLLRVTEEHGLVVQVAQRIGEFVLAGETLLSVWPRGAVGAKQAERLRSAIVLGPARTPHQDVELGIIELMDIAVKALSPGINDPTTATIAIDRLAEVLLRFGQHRPHAVLEGGRGGRVLVRRLDFDAAVSVGFRQIRHFGARNGLVARHMVDRLGDVASLLPREVRSPLLREIAEVRAAAARQVEQEQDRMHVLSAADRAAERAMHAPDPVRTVEA